MVAKLEWGRRHVCIQCGARFYDMQKKPILCPRCETEFDPEILLKRKARIAPEGQTEEVPPFETEIDVDLELVDTQREPDDSVLEDADDLGNAVSVNADDDLERDL